MNFYVTFGQKYRREQHRTYAAAHPDGWVTIEAPTYQDAANAVTHWLSDQYAFLYAEDNWEPHWFKRGEMALLTVDDIYAGRLP